MSLLLDEMYWNVYTSDDMVAAKGGAFVATPRATRRDANYAAVCRSEVAPNQLREAGVSYRVVYRPRHPSNMRRRRWAR